MWFGLFKSKEERKKEEAEKLARAKVEHQKKEEQKRRELERLQQQEEEIINRFSVKDLPEVYKKISTEKNLKAKLARLGNSYDEVKQKEKIKARIANVSFWKKVRDHLESSDEYPFWRACSLMDDTIENLKRIFTVGTSLKKLEREYGDLLESSPENLPEGIEFKYIQGLALYDFLSKQEEERSKILEKVVLTAVKKEVAINPSRDWPPYLASLMSEALSMRFVAYSWKSYSVERYITEKDLLKPLLRKKSQLVYFDDYGEERKEEWEKELFEFSKRRNFDEINEVCSRLPNRLKTLLDRWVEVTERRVNWHGNDGTHSLDFYWFSSEDGEDNVKRFSSILEGCLISHSTNLTESHDEQDEPPEKAVISPYEFEEKIGRKFKILGWNIQVTKGSGDQGADVVITKGDTRGVVQCKLYSQPVGNKAVQEVHAAKGFYDANFAVVVSNQSFTVSARMLANKLNVYLINEDEIKEFSELLS